MNVDCPVIGAGARPLNWVVRRHGLRRMLMRTVGLSIFCAFLGGLSSVGMSAEGDVDFTDYNDVGLQLYDAIVRSTGNGYTLSGRLANAQMKLTLRNPEVLVVAQDCSYSDDGSGVCVEIARQSLTIPQTLPPRTTAALNVTVTFKESPLKVAGLLQWSVWVLSAERQVGEAAHESLRFGRRGTP